MLYVTSKRLAVFQILCQLFRALPASSGQDYAQVGPLNLFLHKNLNSTLDTYQILSARFQSSYNFERSPY